MAGLTLKVEVPQGVFSGYFAERTEDLARAASEAMKRVGEDARSAGRANITAAGFRDETWGKAWKLFLYPKGKSSLKTTALLVNVIPYSGVFEEGATVRGDLLWLPFSSTPVYAGADRKKLSPAKFGASIGGLQTLPFKTRTGGPILGAPMLVTASSDRSVTRDKLRRGNEIAASSKAKRKRPAGIKAPLIRLQPLFFGVSQVDLPRKLDLVRTTEQVAARFSDYFAVAFDNR